MIAKSTVNEVQIYRNSASVIRNGELELTEGRNIVYIGGMTVTAKQEDFVLKFPENIKAANIQLVLRDDIDTDEEKESEKIKRQIEEVDYQIETCTLLKKLRETNGDFSGRMDVSVEAQEQYMVALPRQLMDLHKQLNELNDQKKKLNKEYDKAVDDEAKPIIMAELISESAGTIPFILRYQEKACSWKPKYEVRFKSNEEPLEVSMKARIYQNSNEDWKQVKASLYTGNPAQFHGLPVLDPVQVSIYEEPQVRARGMMDGMAAGASAFLGAQAMSAQANGFMGMAMAEAAPMMKMAQVKMDEAEVSEEETMSAYILPGLKDIMTNTGNLVVLQNFDVKADYHLLSIPRVDNKCFLTAEIVDADWPLPPAYASVYIKDLFAGDVYVDPDSDPSEKFSLSLGQDERLTVVRTELPRKTSEALIKNQKKQARSYKITLTNNSKENVKVLIKDQIPVSTDKSISVDVNKLSDGSLDVDKGEVKWEITAEPASSIELEIAYSISWPKDKKIQEKSAPLTSRPVPPPADPNVCPTCGNNGGTGKFCVHCGSPLNR